MTSVQQKIDFDQSLGKVSYGYGLIIDTFAEKKVYRHGGHFNGIRTHLSYDPVDKISIILLSNISPAYTQTMEVIHQQDIAQISLIEKLHGTF